jgi:hypothetical protein
LKVPFEIKNWTTLIRRMVEKVEKIFQLVQELSKIFSLTIVIKLKKKKHTNDLHLVNPQSSPSNCLLLYINLLNVNVLINSLALTILGSTS